MAEICIVCGRAQRKFSQEYPSHTLVRLVPSRFHDAEVLVYPPTEAEVADRTRRPLFRSRPATLVPSPGIIAEVSIHSVCFGRVSKVRGGVLADKIAAISLRRNMRSLEVPLK